VTGASGSEAVQGHVGVVARWVLLQGGCCYKVGAATRWVLVQSGWWCKVVPRKYISMFRM